MICIINFGQWMLFFNQLRFLLLLLFLGLNPLVHAMKDDMEESTVHFMTLKNNLKDLKTEREDPLFYVIPLNAPIFYFGFLETVRIQAANYRNHLNFPVPALFKKDPAKEVMLFTPRLSYDLYPCVLEYKMLHMTRKEFIETQTNPPFYTIFYKERPLYIFILPTVHTLPFDALPMDIQNIVYAIAEIPGSELVKEIVAGDATGMQPLQSPVVKLDIETFIQRESNYYKKFYNLLPEQWEKIQLAYGKMLTEGWTKILSPKALEQLSELSELIDMKIENFDKIDPLYIFYYILLEFNGDYFGQNKSEVTLNQLDDCISDIFSEKKRQIHPLETGSDRYESEREENEKKYIEICCSTPQGAQEYFPLVEKNLENLYLGITEDTTIVIPTLNDLEFGCSTTMNYLRGVFKDNISSSINRSLQKRNQIWWERTLNPLLEKRAYSENLSPILIIGGSRHFEGPTSIINWIREKEDFEVRRFNHRGTSPLALSKNVEN